MKAEEITNPVPVLIRFPRFLSSIERRLSLLLSIIMLVLISVGGLSLWLSSNVERSTRTMLSTFEQMDQPSNSSNFQAVLAGQAEKMNQVNALVRLFSIAGICTGIAISLIILWGARRSVFSRLSR